MADAKPQLKRGHGSSKSLDDSGSITSSSKQENITPEQKALMWKTRILAIFLTVIFIIISFFESARIILCIGSKDENVIYFSYLYHVFVTTSNPRFI
jgi:hypothetical protein